MRQHASALQFVREPTRDLCLLAVQCQCHGAAFFDVPPALQTAEMCEAALLNYGDAEESPIECTYYGTVLQRMENRFFIVENVYAKLQ